MSLPARDDIDSTHRFDLTRIYETPAEWDAAREALEDRLDELQSHAADPLEAPSDVRSILTLAEECYRQKQRLELYATLARNIATESDTANDRRRRLRSLASEFETTIAAVRRRFRETEGDRLDALITELDGYRRYAENFREQAAYARSPEVEEAVAAFEDPRTAPTRVLRSVLTEDFDPPAVERLDGTTVDIRRGNYRTELSHSDRDYRRRVYESYRGEMDRFEGTITRAFVEKLNAADAERVVRGYNTIRDRDLRQRCYPESGLRSVLPEAVHDAMLDGVRSNLDPYHRAQAVRRDHLNVEILRPWDLDTSIVDGDPPELDYAEAREHVLAALEPLGEEYVERLRAFFDERRIDVFPTEGKRTDIPAYCPSSATDGAFVLANFRGDVRTTFFLCHELGHAMHVGHYREGPTRYATCPRPVSEIPSLLHELLLAEHFIAEGGEFAAAARNRLLECFGGNLYGSTMNAAFVHRLASAVGDGEEVTPRRAGEAYADLLAEFRPAVDYGDRAGRDWLGLGLRDIYSNYQYVLGAVGALAVRERLRGDNLSTADYREFLRNTGRERSTVLFKRLGSDVTTAMPYERAAAAFDGYVDAVANSE